MKKRRKNKNVTRDYNDNMLGISNKKRLIPKNVFKAGDISNKKAICITEYNLIIYIDKNKNEEEVKKRYINHLSSHKNADS